MGDLELALADATAAFTRNSVTSDTPITVVMYVTAALPTPAKKRRPGRLKGPKIKTNRAE